MDQRSETRAGCGSGGNQFKENARSAGATGPSVAEAVGRGKDAIGTAAAEAMGSANSDLQALRTDLNSLRDTVTKFLAQAGSEAERSAYDLTSNLAGQVSDAAGNIASRSAEMASVASGQAKTLASELESMARRNPIGAMAGAVLLGVLIGLMGRRNS